MLYNHWPFAYLLLFSLHTALWLWMSHHTDITRLRNEYMRGLRQIAPFCATSYFSWLTCNRLGLVLTFVANPLSKLHRLIIWFQCYLHFLQIATCTNGFVKTGSCFPWVAWWQAVNENHPCCVIGSTPVFEPRFDWLFWYSVANSICFKTFVCGLWIRWELTHFTRRYLFGAWSGLAVSHLKSRVYIFGQT